MLPWEHDRLSSAKGALLVAAVVVAMAVAPAKTTAVSETAASVVAAVVLAVMANDSASINSSRMAVGEMEATAEEVRLPRPLLSPS